VRFALQAIVPGPPIEAQLQHDLGERNGQLRSRSTSSSRLRKQQTSTSSPENSGPTASSVARTRWRAPITVSVKVAGEAPRGPVATEALQFEVMRGIRCARVNSARNRWPASNCTGSISARPSRPLRRASHASGLSASSTVTSLKPVSSRIWRRPNSRCCARNGSMPASFASARSFTVRALMVAPER